MPYPIVILGSGRGTNAEALVKSESKKNLGAAKSAAVISDHEDADILALGEKYKVQTKAQLNELFYKVINTENIISYLVFTLIMIIAMFNVIGTLIMMIIDKKKNLQTFLNLGATLKDIRKIFVLQGFLLTLVGMSIGLVIAILLVLFQQQFEWFMITATIPYPVELQFYNVLLVSGTITILGFLAATLASSRISIRFLES